eukprot:s2637_g5.t1
MQKPDVEFEDLAGRIDDAALNTALFFTVKPSELRILSALGAGAHANVYKAEWTRTFAAGTSSIIVAVKQMHTDLGEVYRNRERLTMLTDRPTARTSAEHPNLVKCVDSTLEPPYLIITEFLAGGSLFDLLYNSDQELSLWQQVKILLDVASGMKTAELCSSGDGMESRQSPPSHQRGMRSGRGLEALVSLPLPFFDTLGLDPVRGTRTVSSTIGFVPVLFVYKNIASGRAHLPLAVLSRARDNRSDEWRGDTGTARNKVSNDDLTWFNPRPRPVVREINERGGPLRRRTLSQRIPQQLKVYPALIGKQQQPAKEHGPTIKEPGDRRGVPRVIWLVIQHDDRPARTSEDSSINH